MGMRWFLIGCTMLRKMAHTHEMVQKSVKYLKEPFLMTANDFLRLHPAQPLCLSRLLWTGMHMAPFTVTSFLGIRLLWSRDKAPFPTLCRFLTSCTASVPHHKICFWYGSLISQNVKWGFCRLGMHGATFTVTSFPGIIFLRNEAPFSFPHFVANWNEASVY